MKKHITLTTLLHTTLLLQLQSKGMMYIHALSTFVSSPNQYQMLFKSASRRTFSKVGSYKGRQNQQHRNTMKMWGESLNTNNNNNNFNSNRQPRQGDDDTKYNSNNNRRQRSNNENYNDNVGQTSDPLVMDRNGRKLRTFSRNSSTQSDNDDYMSSSPSRKFRSDSYNDYTPTSSSSSYSGGGGWDDFLPDENNSSSSYEPYNYSSNKSSSSNNNKRTQSNSFKRNSYNKNTRQSPSSKRNYRENNSFSSSSSFDSAHKNKYTKNKSDSDKSTSGIDRKINLRALEKAGFVHLYGLAPILNALHTNKRDFTNMEDSTRFDSLKMDNNENHYNEEEEENQYHEKLQRERKPEAKFTTHLFVQDSLANVSSGGSGGGGCAKSFKSYDKTRAAMEIEVLAQERNIPIAYVDKGVLNVLCDNRPHQGYVLRCGSIEFEALSQIPHPKDDPTSPSLWLVLDEIVDPQNFGALLRSAYFLGNQQKSNNINAIGILVCSKNSAPPSSTVSAASAGALELLDIYSTSNLSRTLTAAKNDGWRILGASASVPDGMVVGNDGGGEEEVTCVDLYNLENVGNELVPTLLVLGSEGHGLRTLVARSCTGFVRIPNIGISNNLSSDDDDDGSSSVDGTKSQVGVDSLNVSVTGGIMLWHLLFGNAK